METDSLEHWPKQLKIFCGYVTILQPHMTIAPYKRQVIEINGNIIAIQPKTECPFSPRSFITYTHPSRYHLALVLLHRERNGARVTSSAFLKQHPNPAFTSPSTHQDFDLFQTPIRTVMARWRLPLVMSKMWTSTKFIL